MFLKTPLQGGCNFFIFLVMAHNLWVIQLFLNKNRPYHTFTDVSLKLSNILRYFIILSTNISN